MIFCALAETYTLSVGLILTARTPPGRKTKKGGQLGAHLVGLGFMVASPAMCYTVGAGKYDGKLSLNGLWIVRRRDPTIPTNGSVPTQQVRVAFWLTCCSFPFNTGAR